MTGSSFLVIKIILGVVSGLFGILAAFFTFLDVAYEDKHEKTRAWFRAKWIAVSDSPWLTLPERIIEWLLRFKTLASQTWSNYAWRLFTKPSTVRFVNITVFSLFALGCLFHSLLYGIYLSACMILLLLTVFGVTAPIAARLLRTLGYMKDGRRTARIDYRKVGETADSRYPYLVLFYSLAFYGSTAVLWILIMLKIDICLSTLIMTAMSPLYWLITGLAFYPCLQMLKSPRNLNSQHAFYLFNFAIAISFTITFLALLVGHIASPEAWVPQTFQMLLSNVLFDGVTLLVAFMILAWAVAGPGILRIPIAVFADILVASLLACGSIFFGLVFTDKSLSVNQVTYVLLGKAPDGSHFEIGPYFWAMHTTFLPSLLYLALVFFTWLGKAILLPIKWFFGKGQVHKNPLKLAAALCFLVATLFGFFVFATESTQRYFEKQKQFETVLIVDHPFGPAWPTSIEKLPLGIREWSPSSQWRGIQ